MRFNSHHNWNVFAIAASMFGAMLLDSTATLSAKPDWPPAPLAVSRDWTYGCDNRNICQAVALLPEKASSDYLTLFLLRGFSYIEIQIAGLKAKGDRYQIFIDGRLSNTGLIDSNSGVATIFSHDALKLARAMAKGRELVVKDANGASIGRISLAGSTAALRALDKAQGLRGYTDAFVSSGRKKRLLIPMQIPPSPGKRIGAVAEIPDASSLVKLAESNSCSKYRSEVSQDSAHSLGKIDGRATALVLLNCGAGQFSMSSLAMIGTLQPDGQWSFTPAKFHKNFALDGKLVTQSLLIDAVWDQPSQTLSSTRLARAEGDCGEKSIYVWDGKQFLLVMGERMDACRGARTWITVWRDPSFI
jgi:Protein of unknown function (DUF1176)